MVELSEEQLTKGISGRWMLAVLCALGASMLGTNRWFTAVDDEVTIIDRASLPASTTIHFFLSGAGQHEHPPLYDILLHDWLRLTSGNIHLVRLPAAIFYLLGIWIVAKTALMLGGRKAEIGALALAVLSPYGFHFGRVAAWYSFCFFLVALLTWLYFEYLEKGSAKNWIWLLLVSLALVYSNYFGWALLGLLTFDFVLVNWRKGWRVFAPVLAIGGVVIVAFLPILLAFVNELHTGVRSDERPLTTVLTGVYVLYAMFVSESVAPWFWALGVPAGLAIGAVVALTILRTPGSGRRLLIYFFAALAAMSAIGVVSTKRALMILPWLLLPIALAIAQIGARSLRRAFTIALILIFAIGWFGIFDRKIYAAPHWTEPWSDVADEAASVVRGGGIVIGNHQSFFFYLTYLLPPEKAQGALQFPGLLPDSVRRSGVYTPEEWMADLQSGNAPLAKEVMLANGLQYDGPQTPTDGTRRWLDKNCAVENDEPMAPDLGSRLKLRFGPADNQVPWRVDVRRYDCSKAMAGGAAGR
jgi:Dolichyl-phosphate-mannose-protein mannosyltransferase